MHRQSDMRYSILIVSSSDRFVHLVKKSLEGFITIDVKKSATLARRCLVERDYDIIVIQASLPDESGIELVRDSADRSRALILFITPVEIYDDVLENVTDRGVLVITDEMADNRLDKSIRYLVALQGRIHSLEQKTLTLEEKMQEIRLVNKAKAILIGKQGLSESEAHKAIGKLAMDNGVSRGDIARRIITEVEKE